MLGRIFYHEGVTQETQARLHGLNSSDLEQRKAGLKDLELAFAAYQEAIRRLAEAVAREEAAAGDSWNPETTEARYLVAEARRRSAQLPRKKMATVAIETLRTNLHRQMQQELLAAVEAYRQLQDGLDKKQERIELTELEAQILPQLLLCPRPCALRTGTLRRGDPGLCDGQQPLPAAAGVVGGLCANRELPTPARPCRGGPRARWSRRRSC